MTSNIFKINNVQGWGISRDKLHSKLFNGAYKLQTLDIDFGTKCSLHCPHCFKSEFNQTETKGNALTFDETKEIILQAKELGLESIKILGAGDPLENEDFLDFIKFSNFILSSVFFCFAFKTIMAHNLHHVSDSPLCGFIFKRYQFIR